MRNRRAKKVVPVFAVGEVKNARKSKPVGWMRNPDLPGCVVDIETFKKINGVKIPD